MHGEYKVPGGKLVVVDIEVREGRLHEVRLSGDFFLEPDTALEAINTALTGLDSDAGAHAMTQAIEAALGPDVRMFGFAAADVAIAVGRALNPEDRA